MLLILNFQFALWLVLGVVALVVVVRGFWLYRASLTRPTADMKTFPAKTRLTASPPPVNRPESLDI
jgi:hypothetical protein